MIKYIIVLAMLFIAATTTAQQIITRIVYPTSSMSNASISPSIRVEFNYPIDTTSITKYGNIEENKSVQVLEQNMISVMPDSLRHHIMARGKYVLVNDTTLVYECAGLNTDTWYAVKVEDVRVIVNGNAYTAPDASSAFKTASDIPILEKTSADEFHQYSIEDGVDVTFTGDIEYSIINNNVCALNRPIVEMYELLDPVYDPGTGVHVFNKRQLATTSEYNASTRTLNMKVEAADALTMTTDFTYEIKINTRDVNGDSLSDRSVPVKLQTGSLFEYGCLSTEGEGLPTDYISHPRDKDEVKLTKYGDTLVICAIDSLRGWKFSHWSCPGIDYIDGDSSPSLTYVHTTVTRRRFYSITAVYSSIPSITFENEAVNYGQVLVVDMNSKDTLGLFDTYDLYSVDNLQLIAEPDSGYYFDGWESDDQIIASSPNGALSINGRDNAPTYIRAKFASQQQLETYKLRIIYMSSDNIQDYSSIITTNPGEGEHEVTADQQITLNADILSSDLMYRITEISLINVKNSANKLITDVRYYDYTRTADVDFVVGDADVTVVVFMKPKMYTITVSKSLMSGAGLVTDPKVLERVDVILYDVATNAVIPSSMTKSTASVDVYENIRAGRTYLFQSWSSVGLGATFHQWGTGPGHISGQSAGDPSFQYPLNPDNIEGTQLYAEAEFVEEFVVQTVKYKMLKEDGSTEIVTKTLQETINDNMVLDYATGAQGGYTATVDLEFSAPVSQASVKYHPLQAGQKYSIYAMETSPRVDYSDFGLADPEVLRVIYAPDQSYSNVQFLNNTKTVRFIFHTPAIPIQGLQIPNTTTHPNGVNARKMSNIMLRILSGADGIYSSLGTMLSHDVNITFRTVPPTVKWYTESATIYDDTDPNDVGEIFHLFKGSVFNTAQKVDIRWRYPENDGDSEDLESGTSGNGVTTSLQYHPILEINNIKYLEKIELVAEAWDEDNGSLIGEVVNVLQKTAEKIAEKFGSALPVPSWLDIAPIIAKFTAEPASNWLLPDDERVGTVTWHINEHQWWGARPSLYNDPWVRVRNGQVMYKLLIVLE